MATYDSSASPAPKGKGMSDEELTSLLKRERRSAKDFVIGQVGRERRVAYEYYYGKPFGNEEDGRSQVVSQVVSEVIDAALPDIIKIFAGSDTAVECTPRNAEDVEAAEQATDLCNYVFWTQNNGFLLMYEGIKDALLQKTGVWKYYWDDEEKVVEERYDGLTVDQLTQLHSDPQVELVQASPRPDPYAAQMMAMQQPQGQRGAPPDQPLVPAAPQGAGAPMQPQVPMLYDVRLKRTKTCGQVRIECVPPEEVLVSPRARTVDAQQIPYIGTRTRKTLSDLVAMGYDRAEVRDLKDADGDGDDLSEVRAARIQRSGSVEYVDEGQDEDFANPMMREVWYCEEYVLVDYDDDGIAERRVVCSVGDTILHNETIERVPLAIITPKIMPHEFYGISLADDSADLQLLKSTLWRQTLDNLYLTNSPQQFVQGTVDIDALLNPVPGGVVRGDPGSAITPLSVQFMAGNSFQMIEFLEQEVAARTGVDRQGFSPSLNPEALTKTLGGANIALNKSQSRIELMARTFAETGITELFKGVLWLLGKHQDTALTLRIRNKFVTIDPRAWSTEYDFTVNVGLGTGSKDQQMQHMGMLMEMIEKLAGAGIATPKNMYNAGAEMAKLLGFKDTAKFVTDPSAPPDPTNPKPQPQPNPMVQAAQVKAQADQQMAQMKVQADGQIAQAKAQADMQVEAAKMQATQAREQAQMQADMQTQQQEAVLRNQMELDRARMQLQLDDIKHQRDQQTAIEVARIHAAASIQVAEINAGAKVDAAKNAPQPQAAP